MHAQAPANYPMIVISIAATALCWGVYGPLLQWGHGAMGSGRLRPFICVGIAYVFIAVIGPILCMMLTGMEKGEGLASGWTTKGIMWSFIAGVAGAVGALGMILAFNFGGKPSYVPPLIFGLAPVVNTFFTLSMSQELREQLSGNAIRSSFFGAGLLMVAVGAVVVLVAAPKAGPKPPVKTAAVEKKEDSPPSSSPAPTTEKTPPDSSSANPS